MRIPRAFGDFIPRRSKAWSPPAQPVPDPLVQGLRGLQGRLETWLHGPRPPALAFDIAAQAQAMLNGADPDSRIAHDLTVTFYQALTAGAAATQAYPGSEPADPRLLWALNLLQWGAHNAEPEMRAVAERGEPIAVRAASDEAWTRIGRGDHAGAAPFLGAAREEWQRHEGNPERAIALADAYFASAQTVAIGSRERHELEYGMYDMLARAAQHTATGLTDEPVSPRFDRVLQALGEAALSQDLALDTRQRAAAGAVWGHLQNGDIPKAGEFYNVIKDTKPGFERTDEARHMKRHAVVTAAALDATRAAQAPAPEAAAPGPGPGPGPAAGPGPGSATQAAAQAQAQGRGNPGAPPAVPEGAQRPRTTDDTHTL